MEEQVDFCKVISDVEAAWNCVSTLSPQEIFARISNNETRVGDVIGESPQEVIVALGEEFVPTRELAEFRGKFGWAEWLTVFEISDVDDVFPVKWLWEELLGEVRRGDSKGPATVALREALVRLGEEDNWEFLTNFEGEVHRRTRGSCGGRQEARDASGVGGSTGQVQRKRRKLSEGEESVAFGGGVVMDWATKDLQWNLTDPRRGFRRVSSPFLSALPFLLRYCGSVGPAHLAALLLHHKSQLKWSKGKVTGVLQSLLLLSRPPHPPNLFPLLSSFLRDNISLIPPELQSLSQLFLGATREQIAEASSYSPGHLVRDVCVGGVALALISTQQPPTILEKEAWEAIVLDVIDLTPCCDLPQLLQQLRVIPAEERKEVLLSRSILVGWQDRWYDTKVNDTCEVSHFLAFYFSVFGLTLEWMRMEDGVAVGANEWVLVGGIPLEISSALRGDPHWTHLFPKFQKMLREHLRDKGVVSVGGVAVTFSYKTEAAWEVLLPLLSGLSLLPEVPQLEWPIPTDVAAPLLRALVSLYGVEWTKAKLTKELWNKIPFLAKDASDAVRSLGSLLHSAIQLDQLEEVRKRAWPGLMKWRNSEGRTALQLAREKYNERHPIRVHLEERTRSIKLN